jgi:hypothetical protein
MPAELSDEGVITKLERLKNSINGNPRFLVTLDNGNTYTTVADGFIGYQLQTSEFIGPTVRLLIKRVNRSYRVFDVSVI